MGVRNEPPILDCILGVLHSMSTQAGSVEEGYALLSSGDVSAATATWDAVLEESSGSATLHYNLGTAWYRQGDLARAIAHWRMGRVLSPRDTNLVHNLAVARSELTETMEPLDTQPALSQIATPNEWGLLGGVSAPYLRLGAMGARLQRKTGPWPWLGVGMLGILVCLLSASILYTLRHYPGAVVTDRRAFIRALSVRDAEVIGQIVQGTEVAVDGFDDAFVLIRARQDLRGWIQEIRCCWWATVEFTTLI